MCRIQFLCQDVILTLNQHHLLSLCFLLLPEIHASREETSQILTNTQTLTGLFTGGKFVTEEDE